MAPQCGAALARSIRNVMPNKVRIYHGTSLRGFDLRVPVCTWQHHHPCHWSVYILYSGRVKKIFDLSITVRKPHIAIFGSNLLEVVLEPPHKWRRAHRVQRHQKWSTA